MAPLFETVGQPKLILLCNIHTMQCYYWTERIPHEAIQTNTELASCVAEHQIIAHAAFQMHQWRDDPVSTPLLAVLSFFFYLSSFFAV